MIKIRKQQNKVDTAFVLLIFCVFAVSVLVVLMLGGSIYRNMVDISRDGHDERTALSYVRTKIRNLDSEGFITVEYFDGIPSLSVQEVFGDRIFNTRIYHYDGYVRELFHEAGFEFYLGDGTRIVSADKLYFEALEDGLIRASTDIGSLIISPRSTASTDQLMREGF